MSKTSVQTMNDSMLKDELREGEKLIWSGSPEEFPLLTEKTRKGYRSTWLICAVCFVVFSAAYLFFAINREVEINYVVLAVIAVACIYPSLMPMLDRRKILRQCSFYITDQRVMSIVNAKERHTMSLKNIKVNIIPEEKDCVSVLLGSAADIPEKKHRTTALMSKKDEGTQQVQGIVFYNVRDNISLRKCFLGDKATEAS